MKDREKTTAWIRGFDWAVHIGYKKLRDIRLIAMGYEAGHVDAKKRRRPVKS